MNYYERHLGDYAKDTAHLSMLEHGAYTLLLDRYYGTEQGIPADQAHRVARARSREEKAAVDAVLSEFFRLTDGVWLNARAIDEIEKATARISAAHANGKKGGRPKKTPERTQEKPSGFPLGSENETQQKAHHTPHTNHQSPDKEIQQHTPTATSGGRVCLLMRTAGIADGNPGHPDLLALLAAGATDAEFEGAARSASAKGKGFAYALGTLKRQREEAAKTAKQMHNGAMPTSAPKDRKSRQLLTAALMTGAMRAMPPMAPTPETIDVETRVITA